jgi:hypothetical protein
MTMLAAALLTIQGGSIHELQLDMNKRNVEDVLGTLGTRDASWPGGATEKFDVPGGSLFFCGNLLHTVIIELSGSVQSFSRAVNAETKARGAPTYKFSDIAWGAVEARWRMEPYKYLEIQMYQYRPDDEIKVERVLERLQLCKNGALE